MMAINFFIFTLMSLASFFKSPINLCLTVVTINMLLGMTLFLSHGAWIFLTFSMIYIGAMMVMFAYFSAISSTLTDSSLFMQDKMIIYLQALPMGYLLFSLNPNMFPQTKMENFIMYIYASFETILFMLLFMLLYFTMILVSKIVENKKSALRTWD